MAKVKKVKKVRLRVNCDLCRHLKQRTPLCTHQSCAYFPGDMNVSELPEQWQLEINPKR